MSYPFKNGQQSVVLRFKLLDSSSTVGAGLTGLTSASAGLIISTIADVEATATAYTQAGGTIEGITTLGTFATPTATKCRFKEVDATNHKGVYEFQFANARFAVANAKSLLISVSGAANLAQVDYVVPLVVNDPYVANVTTAQIATAVWQDSTAGDFTTASSIGKSLYTAGVVPGAAGGLFIAGTNAILTITGTFSANDGFIISRTTADSDGMSISGSGIGNGLRITAVDGNGIQAQGGANGASFSSSALVNGVGLVCSGAGSGEGLSALGGSSGHGLSAFGGNNAGAGIKAAAGFFSVDAGMDLAGAGTGPGLNAVGGVNGDGGMFTGGATSGDGVSFIAAAAGDGLRAAGAGGGADIRGNIIGNVTGTVLNVTNLTNAATVGDFTAVMKASLNASTPSVPDVWSFNVPAAYAAGTAGFILGTNLNAPISGVPSANANADALLGRNVAGGSSAGRTVKEAMYFLRNKWTVIAGVLSVYDTADTVIVWTAAIASDAAAVPIVGSDPT